ncbi:cytochrome c oxidase subunit II [bacterium]|nr:MAG: cytochrome c oxidase subunit II [bacterium]
MLSGASSYAGLVDRTFWLILVSSVILLVGITAVMIWFMIRYRRSRNPNPAQIEGNVTLEAIWTILPTILVMVMFYYGWAGFKVMREIPDGAFPVTVRAQMWSWSFIYPDGRVLSELIVPVGKPVKLKLESADVIHSFFVPAFRLKEDCVPGRANRAWFQAERPGDYTIFCAEYCGEEHSAMLSTVKAIPVEEFDEFYGGEWDRPQGVDLITVRGCVTCHSLDGSKLIGPSFKGIWGSTETVITDGQERRIIVDEEYIRRSILTPAADLVAGYQNLMPDQSALVDSVDINSIIEFIKELE